MTTEGILVTKQHFCVSTKQSITNLLSKQFAWHYTEQKLNTTNNSTTQQTYAKKCNH